MNLSDKKTHYHILGHDVQTLQVVMEILETRLPGLHDSCP